MVSLFLEILRARIFGGNEIIEGVSYWVEMGFDLLPAALGMPSEALAVTCRVRSQT